MLYMHLGRRGYLRNTAYRWSHMVNNLASAIFGFIYISLWQAVAPVVSQGDPYTRTTMVGFVVMAQIFAWITLFLPAGLGIQAWVRTGNIALEMARPVPFFPLVLAREAGNIAYHALYRSVPVALLFGLAVGLPAPGSALAVLLTIPSLLLGAYVGLCLVYTVGMTSLWTVEVRWAHWLYYSCATLLSGGWIPADLLPGALGQVAPYLPFAAQMFYPVRIYLGLSGPEGLAVQAVWAVVMTLWCLGLTHQGLRRLIVQGG